MGLAMWMWGERRRKGTRNIYHTKNHKETKSETIRYK